MGNQSRRALVAGGAGFIGSHLVDSLLNDGWYVDVVDSFVTGKVDNLRRAAEEHEPRLLVVHGDVATADLENMLGGRWTGPRTWDDQTTYDVVYNLACPASPKAYQADPVATVMTNVVGTQRLLEFAESHRAVLVQASTSEVYGDPLEHPQNELYNGNVDTQTTRACYDEGKRAAETLCYEARRRGLDARIARIFNTYGPRMDPYDGRVVSTFVRQAILKEPLTMFGDGQQTRSFCYVYDMVTGLRKLAEASTWIHGPVNLGNDGEFKIVELAEALSEWFPRLLTENSPLPPADPKLRKPDMTLAKRELGYAPTVNLRDGLSKTIEWMRTRLSL